MVPEYLNPQEFMVFMHRYGLIAVGVIGWLWRKIKEERSKRDNIPISDLEVDHIKPRYKGGEDIEDNLQALTRVEHALKHHRAANNAKDKKTRNAERWAVGRIYSRMTDNERRLFNSQKDR